jgi:NitT/TauT family transport system ATP-binding protein
LFTRALGKEDGMRIADPTGGTALRNSLSGSTGQRHTECGARVTIQSVGHVFAHGTKPVVAVWDYSLSIQPGEFVSIVGPSGSGKTTILSMLAGLLQPGVGKVLIDGSPVTSPRDDVAYMFARDALMPWRTVLGNVELGMEVRGVPKKERRERAREWVDNVGLAGYEDSSIQKLSQGMRQRVAIARTLAQTPRLILMDEPFAALDAQTRAKQQAQFTRLWEDQRATIVFITHDMTEAIRLGDRVVVVSGRPGRVLEDVKIELPRPRQLQKDFEAPAFMEYHHHLTDLLNEEERRIQK